MTQMLTTRELTDARADVQETLVSASRIERATNGVNSAGVVSQTWGTAVGTAACRIDPWTNRGDLDGVVAAREATRQYYQGTFEWDEDIALGDRVVFGSDTLEIVQLFDDHSARIVTRALLAKIEGS